MKNKFYLILHNIRSAYNVGSIFRTADGAGIEKIYLTGYSPTPIINDEIYPRTNSPEANGTGFRSTEFRTRRDYGHEPVELHKTKAQKMLAKTALGAEKNVSWEKNKSLNNLIKKLKKEKFQIVALEQDKKSIDYEKFKTEFPLALIAGNEVRGIDKRILKKCDAIIEIPMRGKKNSLNVAVAVGIAGYEIKSKFQNPNIKSNLKSK